MDAGGSAWPAPGSAVWVVEVDGAVVGFCHIGPSPDVDAGDDTRHLHALYVDPRFAGRGLGSALLLAGRDSLAIAGFAEATLWVLAGNTRARAFYEGHGWRPDGTARADAEPGVTFRELRYRSALR